MFYENGQLVNSNIQMGNYTSYPSAFMVVDPDGIYSKHYYAGTQRIAARMGQHNADELFEDKKKTVKLNGTDSTDNTFNPEELKTLQQKDLQLYLDKAGKVARLSFKKYKSGESEVQEQQQENENNYVAYGAMAEELIYYYHPDHLGTATYLTDINGEAYEFFLNLPFGETMAEQHSMTTDYQNRWKFTGHELDRETGLYYANARYYDPKLSIFLSVDMLAEQAPSWTPYRYGFNNPVRYTDPTGMYEEDFDDYWEIKNGRATLVSTEGDGIFVKNAGDKEYSKLSEYQFSKNTESAAQDIVDYYSEGNSLFSKESSKNFQPFRLNVKYFSSREAAQKEGFSGKAMMTMSFEYNGFSKKLTMKGIAFLYNGRFSELLDNKYNMINSIEHEYKHYLDYTGINTRVNYGFNIDIDEISRDIPKYELRAIDYQRGRSSWINTTSDFKTHISDYEKDNRGKL